MDAGSDASAGTGGTSGAGGESDAAGGTGPAPGGLFDPREIYLLGTLSEGECYFGALTHWAAPNEARTGFDCDIFDPVIDPQSNRFVFVTSRLGKRDLLVFVADGSDLAGYPPNPHQNDVLIPTVCENPRRFFADPAGGEIVYQCYGDDPCVREACQYYYESGTEYEVPEGYYLLHRGFDGTALLGVASDDPDQENAVLVMDQDGGVHPVDDYVYAKALRAHPSGFWAMIGQERWNIGFDGSFLEQGSYPEPPPWSKYRGDCALEASGASLCFGRSTDVLGEDHLIRAELGADVAEVVYTEAAEPLVRIHKSKLVTGP